MSSHNVEWKRLQSPTRGWVATVGHRPVGDVLLSHAQGLWYARLYLNEDARVIDMWSVGQHTAWAAMSWLRDVLDDAR